VGIETTPQDLHYNRRKRKIKHALKIQEIMNLEQLSFNVLHPQPLIIVISGTSGIGKDAVIGGLKRLPLPFHFVITATSRAPRSGEKDGVDYFFYSREEFELRIARGEFAEYAMVYQDYKGIPREQIEGALKSGKDVVLKLDVQGAATIRRLYPEAILVFLVPNTVEEWYDRLSDRGSETLESLTVRVDTAIREVAQIDLFDYVVLNGQDRLDAAVQDVVDILKIEHMRVHHRKIL
jgi:guanylate kinase